MAPTDGPGCSPWPYPDGRRELERRDDRVDLEGVGDPEGQGESEVHERRLLSVHSERSGRIEGETRERERALRVRERHARRGVDDCLFVSVSVTACGNEEEDCPERGARQAPERSA